MIGGLSRTSRVKRVNMESSLSLVNDVIFRELWNSKSNYRDSWFATFNRRELCAWPPLRPLIAPRKITLLKHKSRRKQRIRCRKKCRYFEDICFSFRGKTQIKSKRGVVTNYKRRNDLQPATNTWKIQQPPQKQAGLQCNSHSWRHISPFRLCHINSPPGS